MKISLLCPSRGRPEICINNIKNWLSRSYYKDNIEVVLSVDRDDTPKSLEMYWLESHMIFKKSIGINYGPSADYDDFKFVCGNNTSAVDAINRASKYATGDIMIVVSDDTDCPNNWDLHITNEVKGKNDWIMKCYDGIQPWLITMPVMDRHYYNRFGYVYYPEYKHMFCDTELTCVADLTGRKLNSTLTFHHLHYSTGKSKRDATSDRADQSWHQGEKLFIDRFVENRFGFMDSPHKIQDKNILNWIDSKIRQRIR